MQSYLQTVVIFVNSPLFGQFSVSKISDDLCILWVIWSKQYAKVKCPEMMIFRYSLYTFIQTMLSQNNATRRFWEFFGGWSGYRKRAISSLYRMQCSSFHQLTDEGFIRSYFSFKTFNRPQSMQYMIEWIEYSKSLTVKMTKAYISQEIKHSTIRKELHRYVL